jgi:hypothetical protein
MTATEARENLKQVATKYLDDLGIIDTIKQTIGYVYIYECKNKEDVKQVVNCLHILGYCGGQIGNSLKVKFDWSV